MTTIMWIAIGMAVGLGSSWIIMRCRHSIVESPRDSIASGLRHCAKAPPKADSYQGVMIRPCLEACQAAVEQQGHRHLAGEAPQLPLTGCDTSKCACRYQRYADRRDTDDRRLGFNLARAINPRTGKSERRFADDNDRRHSTLQSEPSAYFNNY